MIFQIRVILKRDAFVQLMRLLDQANREGQAGCLATLAVVGPG